MKRQTATTLTEWNAVSDDQVLIYKIENKDAIGSPMKIDLYLLETMEITLYQELELINLCWQRRTHCLSIRFPHAVTTMRHANSKLNAPLAGARGCEALFSR